MYCNNCGNEIESGTRFCPSCGAAIETTPREVGPVEGHRQASPRETRVGGNVEGRFSGKASKKSLFLAITGILVLAGLGSGGYWWMHRTPAVTVPTDIVIEHEVEVVTPKTEEKLAEAKPTPTPPVQDKKAASRIVKKAPKASPAPKASTNNEPWRYRVAPAPKPQQPQPQAQAKAQNPLGKLFRVFEGPAPDVTPPSNDPRDTGR